MYWNFKPDKADELPQCFGLNSPESPSTLSNTALDSVGQGVALFSSKWAWEMPHDARIRIQARKRFAIFKRPLPKAQTVCL